MKRIRKIRTLTMDEFIYDFLKSATPAQRNEYLKALKKIKYPLDLIKQYENVIKTLNNSERIKK